MVAARAIASSAAAAILNRSRPKRANGPGTRIAARGRTRATNRLPRFEAQTLRYLVIAKLADNAASTMPTPSRIGATMKASLSPTNEVNCSRVLR